MWRASTWLLWMKCGSTALCLSVLSRVGVLGYVGWCAEWTDHYWVTVTCCIFLMDGKVFIPWGGYIELWMSEGLRDPGTGRGLTEPGSLCTDPPLPSDWPSFFLISFLSLALRFWNQIFTWSETREEEIRSMLLGADDTFYSPRNAMRLNKPLLKLINRHSK